MTGLSVIVPACNEAAHIGACLESLLAQEATGLPRLREILVVANGCQDATAHRARTRITAAAAQGWHLQVLELPEGAKPRALNAGDSAARGDMRVYLDADTVLEAGLIAAVVRQLDRADPAFASGRLHIRAAKSWVTRRYADLWSRLPFMRLDAPGTALYGVNAAGRARWESFPDVIADDTFARLHFSPAERYGVSARIDSSLPEGWYSLFRVRRRQNTGVAEIRRLFPELRRNEGPSPPDLRELLGLLFSRPAGFFVYASVALAVRLSGPATSWDRDR